jgi:hypothetical protein
MTVIQLPPSEKDLQKEKLISDVNKAVVALQKFITIHSRKSFSDWDLVAIEESSDRLLITFETLRRK